MARKRATGRTPFQAPRSPKAPRPPRERAVPPRVRRRRRTATVAVRKDTMVAQTPRARVWWAAGTPKEKKR